MERFPADLSQRGFRPPLQAPPVPRFQTQTSMAPLPQQFSHLIQNKMAYDDLQRRRKALPEDTLLDYNILDKSLQKLKTVFVTLPKAIGRGLRGEQDFTFSEMMLNAKVPYYLGGLFLTLSPLFGGNRFEAIRQGTAVGLYLLGIAATNGAINALYQLRYGVDLGMLYRSKSGQVEKVFGSADFPRFDLLKPRHYTMMARKMGIPADIYEQDGAVREQLRKLIVSSRALKLVVGTLASAVGAGYLARSDAWFSVTSAFKSMDRVWSSRQLGFWGKTSRSLGLLGSALKNPLVEKLTMSGAPLWRQGVIGGGLVVGLLAVGYVLTNRLTHKDYAETSAYRPWAASRFGQMPEGQSP